MRRYSVMLLLYLFCLPCLADEKTDRVESLLARLRREPFHTELICEQMAGLGDGAVPALEVAARGGNSGAREMSLKCLAAMAWHVSPRAFYTTGSTFEDIVRFSRNRVADRLKARIKELEEAKDFEGLVDMVRTGDPAAALAAIEGIERIGRGKKAASEFLESVNSGDWFYAGALLARSPKDILPLVSEKLGSRKENDRLAAVTSLIAGPCPDALPQLLAALEDKSSLVRFKAAEALGVAGDKRAAQALAASLKDDTDYTVRAGAAWALGMLGEKESVAAALTGALADRKSHVVTRAIESLAVVGTKTALDALNAFSQDSSRDSLMRNRAIRAIGQIGGQDALERLKSLFSKTDEVYATVPTTVGLVGEVSLPFLRETLESAGDSDYSIINKCQLALGVMGAQAVPLLLDLLASEKSILRLAGRTLLKRLTNKDFEYDREKWEEYLKENPPK